MSIAKKCQINDCNAKHSGKGYCDTHLIRFRKHGLKGIDRPIQQRTDYPNDYPNEYDIWFGIKQRIYNPNCPAYHNYGGRGLTMQSEWQYDFPQFMKDVGARPSKELTLERVDNELGYIRGNLKWDTRVNQGRNQRCRSTSRTGHRGVSVLKSGLYKVCISFNHKKLHLGFFKDLDKAVAVREQAVRDYWQ